MSDLRIVMILFFFCYIFFPIHDPISKYLILKQEREKFVGGGIYKGPQRWDIILDAASVKCLAI